MESKSKSEMRNAMAGVGGWGSTLWSPRQLDHFSTPSDDSCLILRSGIFSLIKLNKRSTWHL